MPVQTCALGIVCVVCDPCGVDGGTFVQWLCGFAHQQIAAAATCTSCIVNLLHCVFCVCVQRSAPHHAAPLSVPPRLSPCSRRTVRELKEELRLLHEAGSHVGEVIKLMGKNKILVKVCATPHL